MNLLDCRSIEHRSSCMNKEFFIRVILCINLVVKLYHVKIDKASNLFVDCVVSSIHVVVVFEVRSLRCVTDDVIWNNFSQGFSKTDEPSLSHSFVHGIVIFPVNVCSIKIVRFYELSKLLSASNWV